MHQAAYHFTKALGIPLSMNSKQKLTQKTSDDENAPDTADEADISMEIDAFADDTDAMIGTTITSYDPGDMLGKFLAFVNQVQMSSEGMHEYFAHIRKITLSPGVL